MSATYLHGAETIEVEIGGQTVSIVRSAIIALVGIAPAGPVNQLTLCQNDTDDSQFGSPLPGFNIPKTLQIIRGLVGSCPVLVVNVFNSTSNEAQVTNESQTVTNGKFKLAFAPLTAVTIKLNDGTTDADIVLGTDYTLDAYGNFAAISGSVANGTTYKLSYKKLDSTTVTSNQIIGGNTSGVRTGIALFDLAYNTYGFKPKIFIAPGYISTAAIAAAIKTAALKFRAVYLLDEVSGKTVSQILASRGVGASSVFNTSDDRAILLYPWLKAYDDYLQDDGIYPFSAFMAALMVFVDLNFGYWFSPSNYEILNATGIERIIEWSINDPNTEANQLNAAGIVTIAQGYGTGMRAWGNRNASFPTSSSVKNFISLRRADDVIIETMEEAALPYFDKPLNQAQIDTIREAGNELMRVLMQRGAVLPGSEVKYNKDDNPAGELAAGHVTFERVYMIPTPTERITFKDVLDISLLNQFK